MKSTRRLLIVMTALALQATGVCLVSAQDQPSANTPGVQTGTNAPAIPSGTNMPAGNSASASSALTPDERAHLRKVKKEVLAQHPDLQAEDDTLTQQRQDMEDQGASVTPDARKAFYAKWHDHQQKVRVFALQLDPTLAPIYAKLDAWSLQHVKPAGG